MTRWLPGIRCDECGYVQDSFHEDWPNVYLRWCVNCGTVRPPKTVGSFRKTGLFGRRVEFKEHDEEEQ